MLCSSNCAMTAEISSEWHINYMYICSLISELSHLNVIIFISYTAHLIINTISVRFTMHIQPSVDKPILQLITVLFCCFELLPGFPCPVIQVESGWRQNMLFTPDRRADPCLHSGHPARPQLPPAHSNWVPGPGFEPGSSRTIGFKSQLL